MDTQRFDLVLPGSATSNFVGGFYQTFDKGFGIFIWDVPPLNGCSETRINIPLTLFTGWNSIGFDQIGAPVIAETAATSRFATKANFQTYTNGALYQITSGALTGRVFFLRRAVQELYETNQGPSGFLGLPVAEEVILADGRRRLSFEGGTMEYALNGTPILKNALQAIIITAEDPIRLTPLLNSSCRRFPFRDLEAAKSLFRRALRDGSHLQPRVINTDLVPTYTSAIPGLQRTGVTRRRCRLRPVQYLNNIIEPDHRAIKK